ncbi:hypothetical protein N7488_012430 [Penicillium malachiteum]|nr:hypothetical protein N7488_012430 [Penicillium malachiteum]
MRSDVGWHFRLVRIKDSDEANENEDEDVDENQDKDGWERGGWMHTTRHLRWSTPCLFQVPSSMNDDKARLEAGKRNVSFRNAGEEPPFADSEGLIFPSLTQHVAISRQLEVISTLPIYSFDSSPA